MKKTFTQYLLEQVAPTGHDQGGGPHIKVDIVDIINRHAPNANNEVMYSSLNKEGREKEFFEYYFNKLVQRYGIDAIKDAKMFKNAVTFFFHAPKMKKGHFLKVYAVLQDEKTAKEVYSEVVGKYHKKV